MNLVAKRYGGSSAQGQPQSSTSGGVPGKRPRTASIAPAKPSGRVVQAQEASEESAAAPAAPEQSANVATDQLGGADTGAPTPGQDQLAGGPHNEDLSEDLVARVTRIEGVYDDWLQAWEVWPHRQGFRGAG